MDRLIGIKIVQEHMKKTKWDAFICHASEDKTDVAKPLANLLESKGLEIWYDEFSLMIGDSLRRVIEKGLSKSRYGIIIVSKNFFTKEWPQKELDVLVSKSIGRRKNTILPVWHDVDQNYVKKKSPILSSIVAISTNEGLENIAEKLFSVIIQRKKRSHPLFTDFDKQIDPHFKITFDKNVQNLVVLLNEKSKHYEVNNTIDLLIMIIKERIEKWDIPSTRYATKELFLKIYEQSEENGLSELYLIYNDLFKIAHSKRTIILSHMIDEIGLILFSSWIPEYNVEKGEKGCKLLLRLGIDFISKDIQVTENCFEQIDNLAADMFEPQIFSKEIILASAIHNTFESHHNQELLDKVTKGIETNDDYSDEANATTYLMESMDYAKSEESMYNVNLTYYYQNILFNTLNNNVDKRIDAFIEYFIDKEEREEFDDEFNLNYDKQLLIEFIKNYESLKPNIGLEIKSKILSTKDNTIIKKFEKIIHNSKFLQKIYVGGDMITTFSELIEFLEKNIEEDASGIGLTTYGNSRIKFKTNLSKEQIELVEKIGKKYHTKSNIEWEIDKDQLNFMMDYIVYIDRTNQMSNLISFLKEVNNILEIKEITTGISFNLRNQKEG